jgi:hypothetical protein
MAPRRHTHHRSGLSAQQKLVADRDFPCVFHHRRLSRSGAGSGLSGTSERGSVSLRRRPGPPPPAPAADRGTRLEREWDVRSSLGPAGPLRSRPGAGSSAATDSCARCGGCRRPADHAVFLGSRPAARERAFSSPDACGRPAGAAKRGAAGGGRTTDAAARTACKPCSFHQAARNLWRRWPSARRAGGRSQRATPPRRTTTEGSRRPSRRRRCRPRPSATVCRARSEPHRRPA